MEKRGSPLRLGILLLILTACLFALGYDAWFAKPGSVAANAKIQQFMDMRNQMSVKEAGPVTSADIQKELGRKPTWVENEATHTVEWYCWWGKTPLLSTRRHYLTVLYVGEERRFSKQQLNGPPEEEDLPNYFASMKRSAQSLPTPETAPAPIADGGPPPAMPMGMAPPGMGGKGKGKGRGKGSGAPAGAPPETPAGEARENAPESKAPVGKRGDEPEANQPTNANPQDPTTNENNDKPALSNGNNASDVESTAPPKSSNTNDEG
jgi:hypothetical protein